MKVRGRENLEGHGLSYRRSSPSMIRNQLTINTSMIRHMVDSAIIPE